MLTPSDTPRSSNAAAIAAALWDSADFAGAASYYERALRENPADLESLLGLGRLKLAQNDLAAALVFLERAHALTQSLAGGGRDEWAQRVQRELAWALYRLDRYDLAAALLDPLPGQQGLAAQLHAFGDTPPYRLPPEVEEIALPFLGTDPLPVVGVTVGSGEYPFVIDTGLNQVVLDTGLLRQLGLPTYGTSTARFASGQQAPVGHTILPRLTLGDVTLRDVPAEGLDVRRFAPQLFGFLGTNLLQRFHVLFDFDAQLLRLRPQRAAPFEAWATMTSVPFLLMDGHLLLAPARLGAHEMMAYVTSGMAGAAFAVPETTVQQAALAREDESFAGVSAAGQTDLATVRAERLCLGEWCRGPLEGVAGFFPPELEWRYGFRVGALVAHAFLKGRRWGLDFTRAQMFFD